MDEYFIYTTTKTHSKAQGGRIDRAVKNIDPDMTWNGPVKIPGNQLTGWLLRPNDGTNDYGHVRERNEKAIQLVEEILRKD